jgi:hypothetical protein
MWYLSSADGCAGFGFGLISSCLTGSFCAEGSSVVISEKQEPKKKKGTGFRLEKVDHIPRPQ